MIILLLTIFFVGVYVIYRSFFEKRISLKWLRILIETIVMCVVFPLCVTIMMNLSIFQTPKQKFSHISTK